MSNLATMIMEGSGIGSFGKAKLTHSYDHENGAGLIAMESAEALRDIFEAEFYVPNTCTIAAALEGASCVEESSQAAIMEASVKGAFAKIKEFFIKLKDKVKNFLHNIKRYLLGIFGNDEKWVKTYEKELNALSDKDLKGYEVKMYKYTFTDALDKAGIESFADELMNKAKTYMKDAIHKTMGDKEIDESDIDNEFNDAFERRIKKDLGTTDPDEIQKKAWSKMRNGADDEHDKDTVSISKSQISDYITVIKNATKDIKKYDDCISGVDKAYNKCIKFIDDCEKNITVVEKPSNGAIVLGDESSNTNSHTMVDGKKAASSYGMILRKYSAHVSKIQGVENTIYTAAKTAMQERNRVYKKVLTGAFGYAKKNKGGK